MLKVLSFLFLVVGLVPIAMGYNLHVDKFEDTSIQAIKLRFPMYSGNVEYTFETPKDWSMSTPENDPLRLPKQSGSIYITLEEGYEKPTFVVKEEGTGAAQVEPKLYDATKDDWTSFSFRTEAARITDIKASLITREAWFDQNYGNNVVVGTNQVSYGHPYGQLPTVTRTGYTFEGWWSTRDESGGIKVTADTVFKGNDNPRWYARWTPETYKVALNAQGGTIMDGDVTSYTYGQKVALPIANQMKRDGYTFDGWYEEITYAGKRVTEISADATGDKTYYARWTARTFDVRFFQNYSSEDQKVVATYSIAFGSKYGQLPTVERTGYTFGEWWSVREPSGGTELTKETTFSSLSAPTNWYARWTANTYTVTLDARGGTIANGADVESYTYSESAGMPLPTADQMIREGWTFVGWYESDKYEGTPVYEIPARTTGVKVYFAKWAERAFYVRFFRNYSSEDQEVVATRRIEFGSKYELPPVTRTGYTLEGWWSTRTGGIQVKSGDVFSDVSAPTNWYAHWTRATYMVTLDTQGGKIVDGKTSTSFLYQYGDYRQLPNQSQMKHPDRLTFGGWYSDQACSGLPISAITANMTGNKTYYAQWKTNWVTFVLHQDQDRASFVPPSDANNPFLVDGNRVAYAVGRSWETLPSAKHADFRYTFVNWYYVQDGQTNTVNVTDNVPDGVTELHARWSFGDPLAQALDADGKLEFVSKVVLTQPETQWSTKWDVGFTSPFFGSSCAVVDISSNEFEKGGNRVAVALETSVVGPGTLSFAWRMRMERIDAITTDPDANTDDGGWSKTAERLMFGVGDGFGDGRGNAQMTVEGFKYGLAATDSEILIVTDPEDTTTKPVSWDGGWTNMSVKIDAEADETNVVRWIYFYSKGVQEWAATGWVDHVVWTPAGSDIVLPKTDTGLHTDITVPADWPDQYPTFADKYGSDLAAALVKPTGKKTADGSPMYVWQDYVIGTDPTDPADRLTASIEMGADGQPIIKWSPDLRTATPKRVYTVYGASTLDGEWMSVTDENRAQMRFFKVGVDVE